VWSVDDLYQDILLDHATRPRNHCKLGRTTAQAEGNNPFCGDRCTVYLDIGDNIFKDIGFEGTGCAILMASASLMTLAVKGRTVLEALGVVEQFLALVTAEAVIEYDLDDLAALAGVRDYPGRIKCATLPWHALNAALKMPTA
jgi:nitrogen fixation NifU-like protein